jgi:hypothetical protein
MHFSPSGKDPAQQDFQGPSQADFAQQRQRENHRKQGAGGNR